MSPSETERTFVLHRGGMPVTLTACTPGILTDRLMLDGLSEEAADTLAYRAWAWGLAAFGLVVLAEGVGAVATWDGGW